MHPSSAALFRSICLASLLAVSAAWAAEPGTATGTMTVNGKKTPLTYAVATTTKNPFHEEKTDVLLLLSNVKVGADVLQDHFGLLDLAGKGNFIAVQVEIDADNQVISGTLYSPEFKKFNGVISVTGNHLFEPVSVTPKLIEGKLSIPKPDDFAGSTYQYSATFKAAIEPAGKGAAGGSSGQAALKGTPLPAGGGAPGKAYTDYLRVLASGNQTKLRACVSAGRAKSMDDPDFKKMLPVIQTMAPKNLHITGGSIDGKNATLLATAKDGQESSTGTIDMVQEGGVWKVAMEKWESTMK